MADLPVASVRCPMVYLFDILNKVDIEAAFRAIIATYAINFILTLPYDCVSVRVIREDAQTRDWSNRNSFSAEGRQTEIGHTFRTFSFYCLQ